MNCRDAQRVLNGYVDAELDIAGALGIEEHLHTCKRCRIEEAGLRSIGATIRRHADRGGAPDALRGRLCARYASRQTGALAGLRQRRAFMLSAFAGMLLFAAVGFKAAREDMFAAPRGHKVVYHISQHGTASAALRTLGNHLEATPGLEVIVVAHNSGVDFLLRGARDENGDLYEGAVRKLAARGVRFRICGNTLLRQHIESARIASEATLVPSGIAEIGRLQAEEGYAYMRL